jgi:ADP-heptose:LPS heptosyltransferase
VSPAPFDRDARPILLVLRAVGLSRLLLSVPALRALAAAFPTHRRVLATTRALAAFALHADLADEVVPSSGFLPLPWDTYRPALAVDLQSRGPNSQRLLLDTHPARLIAFAHSLVPQSWRGPQWREGEHEARRWCRLLVENGIDADPSRLDVELRPRPVPADAVGATLMHPGATTAEQRWPAERWVRVITAERNAGRTVVLTGAARERPLVLAIARRAGVPPSLVYAGRTDASALAALVRCAGRVVSTDSAVAHLATAFRTPSVLLFGPTAPSESGPPTFRSWHRVLWHGGFGNGGVGPHPALLRISADEVIATLRDLPTSVQPAAPPVPHLWRPSPPRRCAPVHVLRPAAPLHHEGSS